MSKELFTIDPYKGEPLDEFAIKADSRHDIAGSWLEKMDMAVKAGDHAAWIFAALCRMRRMRGKCTPEDGFDCVIAFSAPVPIVDKGLEKGEILAVGFDDPNLGARDSVRLLWENTRRERQWTAVGDFDVAELSMLEKELQASFDNGF